MVEDSEDDAELVLRHLQRAGYEVTFARVDSAQAMTAALKSHEWDLIISDHNMPGVSPNPPKEGVGLAS